MPVTSTAYQEEIFGPVVIVNTFESESGVLNEVNCTEFGLFSEYLVSPGFVLLTNISFGLYRRLRCALRVAKASESGAVGVSCSVPLHVLNMPIGGWKQSGIGRELSLHGPTLYL